MFGWESRISRVSVDPEPMEPTMKMGPGKRAASLARVMRRLR
jgi:hypothetical protein